MLPLRSLMRPVQVFALRPPTEPSWPLGAVVNGSEPRPSIAVLPFRRLQVSPEEGYFADGVVDDIIHGLSSLKDLFVVSRASVLGYGPGEATDMLNDYLRTTRRARSVVDRVFWG